MNITHWGAIHRRSILLLFLFLALAGSMAAFKLPVSMFPNINFPRIQVSVDAGDRPADQMVIAVTRKIEEAVRPIPGVQHLRSESTRGTADISINFDWGQNMGSALLQVESAINQALPNLPAGVTFTVRRMDPTVFPVSAYSLTSKQLSQVQLRDIGQQQLVPLLSSIKGVAKVRIMGGDQAEFRVNVSPAKLEAYGLTFNEVTQALNAANVLKAVGRIQQHYKLYLGLSDTRLHSLQDLKNTILKSGQNGFVKLSDIADVMMSVKPQWLKTSANGKEATLMLIYQQPKANTVQITQAVTQRIAEYRDKLPPNLKISNWYDQSDLVIESAKSVRDSILIGVVLAALIVFIFLRSAKITLISFLLVPAALSIATLLLYLLGISFNIMTLGGMAAAVGLIVDDGIVMIEHIIRRLREKQTREADFSKHIRAAAIEFTKPLAGSSSATIIIFVPLAFLSGVTGAFFQALSITMASALFASFLMAWLAVPLLAEHLLHTKDAQKEDNGKIFIKFNQIYTAMMRRLMKRPIFLWVGLIPFLLIAFLSFQKVGSGFMPHMDEGGFVLDFVAPAGTSLTETNRLTQQIEEIIKQNPNVESYSKRTGGGLGGSLHETNTGDFFVKLKPFPRQPIGQVMDTIRAQIDQKVPGIETELILLMEDLIGDLTSVPQPIEIKLKGDNYPLLIKTAPLVAQKIKAIKGVIEVKNGIVLAGDALRIEVNRSKAALEGVDPNQITLQINHWMQGMVTTQIQEGVKMVDVRVWVSKQYRGSEEALKNILIKAPDGHLFPLTRVATIHTVIGQPHIMREDLKRMIAVTGRISGRDMGSTIKEIKQVLAKPGVLPKGVYYELGGLYKQQQTAFKALMAVFVAATGLVFLLLLFMYEDFAATLAIMVSPLLAIGMVFTGLWLTGIELNITAMMGMTMIVGIVTEVSIFYFSEYKDIMQKSPHLQHNEALIQAGINRMRPITMTTLAAILSLIPLALALGQGSQMQQPLAIAIISGLMVQIPLVIIVMPVLYRILSRKKDAKELV